MAHADLSEKVREMAYHLWERAGRPGGREHEFWAEASRSVEMPVLQSQNDNNENRFVAR